MILSRKKIEILIPERPERPTKRPLPNNPYLPE